MRKRTYFTAPESHRQEERPSRLNHRTTLITELDSLNNTLIEPTTRMKMEHD